MMKGFHREVHTIPHTWYLKDIFMIFDLYFITYVKPMNCMLLPNKQNDTIIHVAYYLKVRSLSSPVTISISELLNQIS